MSNNLRCKAHLQLTSSSPSPSDLYIARSCVWVAQHQHHHFFGICCWKCNFSMTPPVRPSSVDGWSIGWSIGSVKIAYKGGKLNFHAPIGSLVLPINQWSIHLRCMFVDTPKEQNCYFMFFFSFVLAHAVFWSETSITLLYFFMWMKPDA